MDSRVQLFEATISQRSKAGISKFGLGGSDIQMRSGRRPQGRRIAIRNETETELRSRIGEKSGSEKRNLIGSDVGFGIVVVVVVRN